MDREQEIRKAIHEHIEFYESEKKHWRGASAYHMHILAQRTYTAMLRAGWITKEKNHER